MKENHREILLKSDQGTNPGGLGMEGAIKNISVSGFMSIREVHELELRGLNIFIGFNS